ncbi:MAG: helix-turn-helix domain-containing protein [bacterium]
MEIKIGFDEDKLFDELVERILVHLVSNAQDKLPFALRVKDLDEMLPISATQIYLMLSSGEIPAKKLGGKWIIPRDIFLTWLYGNGVDAKKLNQIMVKQIKKKVEHEFAEWEASIR